MANQDHGAVEINVPLKSRGTESESACHLLVHCLTCFGILQWGFLHHAFVVLLHLGKIKEVRCRLWVCGLWVLDKGQGCNFW